MAVHAPYIGGTSPPYLESPHPSSHTQAAPVGGHLVDQFPLQGFFFARFSSCKGGHLKTAHWASATTPRGGRRSRPSAGARTRSTGSRDPWCAPGRSKRPPERSTKTNSVAPWITCDLYRTQDQTEEPIPKAKGCQRLALAEHYTVVANFGHRRTKSNHG